jgi:hypothetical protein
MLLAPSIALVLFVLALSGIAEGCGGRSTRTQSTWCTVSDLVRGT